MKIFYSNNYNCVINDQNNNVYGMQFLQIIIVRMCVWQVNFRISLNAVVFLLNIYLKNQKYMKKIRL